MKQSHYSNRPELNLETEEGSIQQKKKDEISN